MVVVPDGRVDYDKLLELLGETEENHLDLKAGFNIDDKADQLKLVKDMVTMSNRPPGGYLMIGVDDDGKPCMPSGTIIDRRRFDGAKLGDLVRVNIEGQIHIRSQVHDHNGNEIVLIWAQNTGLPVPFSKLGQYQDGNGKVQTVFRPGDIFVREGAQNVPIRNAHWPDVLSAYTKQIRDEAEDLAQTVMREFIDQFRQHPPGGPGEIPLLMEMDEVTFTNAVVALIEAKNDVRLRQFLLTLRRYVNATSSIEDCEMALDKWAIFCAQATIFERDDLTKTAIDALYNAYRELGIGPDLTSKRLAVVIRIYALGSLAIRMAAWEIVRSLAIRPVDSNNYINASWIRHAQVEASRAGLTQSEDGRGGFLISAARELMVHHPAMRPDIGDDEIPPNEITANDVLLNTLCQFDIAYCFTVAAMEGSLQSAFYPSSAAFDEDRAKPIALKIVDDPEVRRRLFPDSDDVRVADALALVYHRTIKESQSNYGGRWWEAPQRVTAFIDEHGGPRLLPG
jgi:Schlafen, AlbA_2